MLVEPLDMLCAEAADPQPLSAGDLKPEESLASNVCLQEVKFALNPVLPLCNFPGSLARLGLGEFSVASSNQVLHTLTDSLQLLANLFHRHSFLALSLTKPTIASSSDSVSKCLYVIYPWIAMSQPSCNLYVYFTVTHLSSWSLLWGCYQLCGQRLGDFLS